MKRLIFLSAFFTLVACSNTGPLLTSVKLPTDLNAYNTAQNSPARSNRVLDAVAKRIRFVQFQSNDTNRDGRLNLKMELPFDASFEQMDRNRDGFLSFSEYDKGMQSNLGKLNRNEIRKSAETMWRQINLDANSHLTRAEIETYFTAPYNLPMPPAFPDSGPYPELPPTLPDSGAYPELPPVSRSNSSASAVVPPIVTPLPPPSFNELLYQARKQALEFFAASDLNLDQQLSFSEYEDAYARQLLSQNEALLSTGPSYPYYYPPQLPFKR